MQQLGPRRRRARRIAFLHAEDCHRWGIAALARSGARLPVAQDSTALDRCRAAQPRDGDVVAIRIAADSQARSWAAARQVYGLDPNTKLGEAIVGSIDAKRQNRRRYDRQGQQTADLEYRSALFPTRSGGRLRQARDEKCADQEQGRDHGRSCAG
jgi:hypothetical protein